MKNLKLYCICGAKWEGTLPEEVAQKIEKEFDKIHQGNGHGRCSPAKASQKRNYEESKTDKEF